MQVAKQFCGIDKKSGILSRLESVILIIKIIIYCYRRLFLLFLIHLGKHKVDIVCENTAVKMVSSGEYVNSVTIAFDSITEIADTSLICPAFMDIS